MKLGELVLIACIVIAVTFCCVVAKAQSGFEVAGQLRPCESRATDAPCFMLGDGRVYLMLHPTMSSMSGILSGLEGREVILSVQAK